MAKKKVKQKPGHKEIISETAVKLELFKHGINAYSRFLDMDRIDFITRSTKKKETAYNEIQVKYSRLYAGKEDNNCTPHGWIRISDKKLDRFSSNFFYIFMIGDEQGKQEDLFFVLPSAFLKSKLKNLKKYHTKNGWQVVFDIWKHKEKKSVWGFKTKDKRFIDISKYESNFNQLK